MRARSVFRGVALCGAALAVGAWTSAGPGRSLDQNAFRMGNVDRGRGADRAFTGVTELGSIWASAAAAGVLAAAGHRRAAARGIAAAALTWLAGQGLKKVFLRPRPYEADPSGTRLLIGPPEATSWPSSHPAVLLSFITVTSRDLRAGCLARTSLDALAGLVGVSRTYVGVHYPADVVGGLLVGRAVGRAFEARR